MEKPTKADLEAMRSEYGQGSHPDPHGLPFSLDDDIHQVNKVNGFGISVEEWAEIRGVPVEYARALLRYIESER
jgi:hypothetical protein